MKDFYSRLVIWNIWMLKPFLRDLCINIQPPTHRFHVHGWWMFSLITVLGLTVSALILAINPDLVEGTRSDIRTTARSSFVLFLTALTASAFAALIPAPVYPIPNARASFYDLAFALSNLMHTILILASGQLNPELLPKRTTISNIPGQVGYAFIILLALMSAKSTSPMLGANTWKVST